MKKSFPLASTLIVLFAASYFLIPLYATFQFSLQMLRGQWSFASYRSVLGSDVFLATVRFSSLASLAAIVVGALIVVPTAYRCV